MPNGMSRVTSENLRSAESPCRFCSASRCGCSPRSRGHSCRFGNARPRALWVLAEKISVAAAQLQEVECTSWVNLVILTMRRSLPVYPAKKTTSKPEGTSQKCQQRSSERLLHHFGVPVGCRFSRRIGEPPRVQGP